MLLPENVAYIDLSRNWFYNSHICRNTAKELDIPAGLFVDAQEHDFIRKPVHLDDRIRLVGRIHGQFQGHLVLDGKIGNAGFFIRVNASFVIGAQKTAGIRKVDIPCVLYNDISIGHFSHPVLDVDACVASKDLDGNRWEWNQSIRGGWRCECR